MSFSCYITICILTAQMLFKNENRCTDIKSGTANFAIWLANESCKKKKNYVIL